MPDATWAFAEDPVVRTIIQSFDPEAGKKSTAEQSRQRALGQHLLMDTPMLTEEQVEALMQPVPPEAKVSNVKSKPGKSRGSAAGPTSQDTPKKQNSAFLFRADVQDVLRFGYGVKRQADINSAASKIYKKVPETVIDRYVQRAKDVREAAKNREDAKKQLEIEAEVNRRMVEAWYENARLSASGLQLPAAALVGTEVRVSTAIYRALLTSCLQNSTYYDEYAAGSSSHVHPSTVGPDRSRPTNQARHAPYAVSAPRARAAQPTSKPKGKGKAKATRQLSPVPDEYTPASSPSSTSTTSLSSSPESSYVSTPATSVWDSFSPVSTGCSSLEPSPAPPAHTNMPAFEQGYDGSPYREDEQVEYPPLINVSPASPNPAYNTAPEFVQGSSGSSYAYNSAYGRVNTNEYSTPAAYDHFALHASPPALVPGSSFAASTGSPVPTYDDAPTTGDYPHMPATAHDYTLPYVAHTYPVADTVETVETADTASNDDARTEVWLNADGTLACDPAVFCHTVLRVLRLDAEPAPTHRLGGWYGGVVGSVGPVDFGAIILENEFGL